MIKSKDLREKYLQFFKSKNHAIIQNSSLIPQDDSSALFIMAGMQPLVPYLMGEKHPQGTRLTNSQKCIRTGDIEEVGDNTHHTFFEMLGNWSLGDYFKKEAIEYSFEFITKVLNIPQSQLYISVYKGDKDIPKDDDSVKIWKDLGMHNIVYLDDNFWIAGATGPCGPCSEMYYYPNGIPPKNSNPETDEHNWIEIWNIVFMEYYKHENGKYTKLNNKNVDTGLGFERVLAVLNGYDNTYETDLFQPMMDIINQHKSSLDIKDKRILADHIKASSFLIAEGVQPSNLDKGYILRRLLRRSGYILISNNINFEIIDELVDSIIHIYKGVYDEIEKNHKIIKDTIKEELEKFQICLENGEKMYYKMISDKKVLSAENIFKLWTSFGFPIDITKDLSIKNNIELEKDYTEKYNKLFEEHKKLSRLSCDKKFKGGLGGSSEMHIKYHTTTHILHKALKEILGDHVNQKGSNITEERLRFDFTHPDKLTDKEIQQVEDRVNEIIQKNLSIVCCDTNLDKAKEMGAIGLFENKYNNVVKVYSIGDYTMEICGGPHIENTSVLGKFKIIKEESSSKGVRRIKGKLI